RLRGELAIADGERVAGRLAEAGRALDAVAARAGRLGFKPLIAEIQYSRAMLLSDATSMEAQVDAMREAAVGAEASGDEPFAVKAWTGLADLFCEPGRDSVRGREYASYAKAALDRLGGNGSLEASLELVFGALDLDDGKLADARHHFLRAAELAKTEPARYID